MEAKAHRRGVSGGQLKESPAPLLPDRPKSSQQSQPSPNISSTSPPITNRTTNLPQLPESPRGQPTARSVADRRPSAGNVYPSYLGIAATMLESPPQPQPQQQRQQGSIRAVTPEPVESKSDKKSSSAGAESATNAQHAPLGPPHVSRTFPMAVQSSPRAIPDGAGADVVRRQGRVFTDSYADTTESSTSGTTASSPPLPRASSIRPRTRTFDGTSTTGRQHAAPTPERARVASISVAEDLRGPPLQPVGSSDSMRFPTIVPPPVRTALSQTPSSTDLAHETHKYHATQPLSPGTPASSGRDKKAASRRLIKRSSSRPTSPVISPPPSVDSLPLPIPTGNANNVLLLMRNLCGRMRGEIEYRGDFDGPWYSGIGYIEEEKGSMMFDSGENGPFHIAIVPDLRGCRILPVERPDRPDGQCLEITCPQPGDKIWLRPLVTEEFDLWLAALLSWQQLRPGGLKATAGSGSGSGNATPRPELRERPETRRRGSSSTRTVASIGATSTASTRAERVEGAIIKVGKVKLWDKGMATSPRAIVRRPSARDLRSLASSAQTSWRRVSCILQESGEFKLMTENDVTILSVIELSQLGRCAVQQLDKSVLDEDLCIAIFPIYASTATQLSIFRPVYIALDSRVLFEVWYVLLRAFTVPDMYAIDPAIPPASGDQVIEITSFEEDYHEFEVFRVEKTINLRLTEAKLRHRGDATPGVPQQHEQHRPGKSSGGHGHQSPMAEEDHVVGNYLAEVILDGEVRARTTTKTDTRNPFWREDCEFTDLPAALPFLSVVLKRQGGNVENSNNQLHASLGLPKAGGGVFETTCGAVDIPLHQLEQGRDHEQWLQIYDSRQQSIGSMLVKVHHEELVVLPAREYKGLSEILHKFNNGVTAQIADALPGHLRRVAEILLNIFQVSGGAADWLMALVEEEIDGIGNQANTMKKMRFSRRLRSVETPEPTIAALSGLKIGAASDTASASASSTGISTAAVPAAAPVAFKASTSTASGTPAVGMGEPHRSPHAATHTEPREVPQHHHRDRDQIVRDMSKSLAGEANLLFRGNSLFTQAFEFHMRRLGREYLAETLADKIFEINEWDGNCEVDPGRLQAGEDLRQNWAQLTRLTREIWTCIAESTNKFPPQLRVILKYIRAVAEDRYGDFLRNIVYTSVSGLLFLRFICPAILNPKLFGLLRDHPRPRAQRTLTLIAKGLQALANLTTIGKKETWMDPMNKFLSSHRQELKDFIDAVCSIPATERPSVTLPASYSTPITILGRLSPVAREGFPSLPYLIDHPRSFAALVRLWMDSNKAVDSGRGIGSGAAQSLDGDLLEFHRTCVALSHRSDECAAQVEALRRAAASAEEGDGASHRATDSDHAGAFDDLVDTMSLGPGSTTAAESDHSTVTLHAPSSYATVPGRPPGSSGSDMDDPNNHKSRGRWGRQANGGPDASSMMGGGLPQSAGASGSHGPVHGTMRGLRNGKNARKFLSGLLIKKGRNMSPEPAAGPTGRRLLSSAVSIREREKDGDVRERDGASARDRVREGVSRDASIASTSSKGFGFGDSWGSNGAAHDMGGRNH